MREKSLLKILCYGQLLIAILLNTEVSARTHIAMMGSTVLYPMIAAAIEEFYRCNPKTPPILEAVGSGPSIKAFCHDTSEQSPDIIFASRAMSDSEKHQCHKKGVQDILEVPLGLDAVVFVSATLRGDFSLTVLKEAFADDGRPGKTSWSQIDPTLPDIPISLIGPPLSAGTFDVFAHHILSNNHQPLRQDGRYVAVLGQENLILQKLALAPHALGLISLSSLAYHAHQFHLQKINGITPTLQAIQNKTYPLVRTLYMYVNLKRLNTLPTMSPFLTFLTSEEIMGEHGVLHRQGLIPLSENEQQALRTQINSVLAKGAST